MRRVTLVLAIIAIAATWAGLARAASPRAKAIARCAQAAARMGGKLLRSELQGLDACIGPLFACVETKSADPRCIDKARLRCARQPAALRRAELALAARVAAQCGDRKLDRATLLGDDGLGFARAAPECSSELGIDVVDAASLGACLSGRHAAGAERLFAFGVPRSRELLDLAGIEFLDAPDLPVYPGCDGCGDASGAGAVLQRCAAATGKALRAFAFRTQSLVAQCAAAAFACVADGGAIDARCRAKAVAVCERAAAKIRGARGEREKLTNAILKSCGPQTVPFDAALAPSGGNVAALDCACEDAGFAAIGGVADYAGCLGRQYECRLAALSRLELPRVDAVLGDVLQRPAALESLLCDSSTAAARGTGGPRLLRFIRAIVRPFTGNRGIYVRGGAAVPSGGASMTVSSVIRSRRIAPGGLDTVLVRYRRAGGAFARGAGSDGGREPQAEAPRGSAASSPTVLFAVRGGDGSLVDDMIELPVEAPNGDEEREAEVVVEYQPELRACDFELAVTTRDGGEVGDYANVDQTPIVKLPGKAFLVKDVATTPSQIFGAEHLTDVNGTLFFTIDDGISGEELWRSDGTSAGTVRVKDIVPGPDSSYPDQLTNVNGTLFFTASAPDKGFELWKSDGSDAGTTLVKDIRLGPDASFPNALTAVGNTVFFSAVDDASGFELWKSDGTAAGTVQVKDINPGPASGFLPFFARLANVDGTLYFSANDGSHGSELWRSDGTTAGTMMVKDINPGTDDGAYGVPTSFNGVLYFEADDGTSGFEPWQTDGTEVGTTRLLDLNPGAGDSSPGEFTVLNGALLFSARDATTGYELWRTDGTPAGTVRLRDIRPGAGDSFPSELTVVGSLVFFEANDGSSGGEIWKTDGTAAGTVQAKDIRPGPASSVGQVSLPFVSFNGQLVFQANDGVSGEELWRSDGTAAGTVPILDINPGPADASPTLLTVVGDTLFFSATDPTSGRELWRSDGTAGGTALVRDIDPATQGSLDDVDLFSDFEDRPFLAAVSDQTLLFDANDGASGTELWATDGTAPATRLVKDINPGADTSFPVELTRSGDEVFFNADDGSSGREIWKSDATTAGTIRVKDINAGPASSNPRHLTASNGRVFFSADDGATGEEPWVTDGTEAGTQRLLDVESGPDGSLPSALTDVNGIVFFSATNSGTGAELWRSDGTPAGTMLVRDINPGPALGFAIDPELTRPVAANVNGTFFFAADDGQSGIELWKSNGTFASTVRVKDINPGPAESFPIDLTNVDGTLFFVADDGVNHSALWRSDGTPAGTVLVKTFDGFPPFDLTALGGTLFFRGDDAAHGPELGGATAPRRGRCS